MSPVCTAVAQRSTSLRISLSSFYIELISSVRVSTGRDLPDRDSHSLVERASRKSTSTCDIRTTQIYVRVLNRSSRGVRSPLDPK
jgi:hypothetical protein